MFVAPSLFILEIKSFAVFAARLEQITTDVRLTEKIFIGSKLVSTQYVSWSLDKQIIHLLLNKNLTGDHKQGILFTC